MELAQTYDVSIKTVPATLHKDLLLSKNSARWVTKMFTRRWRRSNWECARQSWRWSPWLLDYFAQCSHCWWVGWQWRASWPASPTRKRPPRRSERGVWKIAQRRNSPTCTGGDTTAVRSAWRLLATVLRKTKNTTWRTYNCSYLLRSSEYQANTLRTYMAVDKKSYYCKKKLAAAIYFCLFSGRL